MSEELGKIVPATVILEESDIGTLIEVKATNVKQVNELADFPTPVAGVITLVANTVYMVNTTIVLGTNRIVMADHSSIKGVSGYLSILVYTGTGDMITSVDKSTSLYSLTLSSSSASKIFNFTNSGKTKLCIMDTIIIDSASDIGIISGHHLVSLNRFVLSSCTGGFTCNNVAHIGIFNLFADSTNSGTTVEMATGTFEQINITNCYVHQLNAGDKAFDIDMSTITLDAGVFVGNTYSGAGTFLTGFGNDYNEWTFTGNKGEGAEDSNSRSETEVVRNARQFPDAVAGVITLLDDYEYTIDGLVDIGTDRIVVGSKTQISGSDPLHDILKYTGTGKMITSSDNDFILKQICIDASAGDVFDVTDTTGTKEYIIQDVNFQNISSLGEIDGGYRASFTDCKFSKWNDGLEIGATNQLVHFFIHHSFIVHSRYSGTGATTFISFQNNVDNPVFKFTTNHLHSKNTADVAINVAGTYTTEFPSLVANDFDDYTGSPISGFDVDDPEWLVKANLGLANFVAGGSMSWAENTGTFTLGSADGWKKITGGTSVGANLKRFTHTSPNRLTYVGDSEITVKINVACAVDYTSGGAFVSAIGITLNGADPNDDTANGFTVYSAEEPCSTNAQFTLNKNDYIEVWQIKYAGGSTNIKASFLNVQVNELS